jgi:cell division transport system permease protein
MKINTVNYLLGDAFKSLKRNKTISIASIITVLITFAVLGTFLLVAENANQIIAGVEDKIEIKVYLKEDIKLIEEREIQVKLREQAGVSDVTYESKEEAYKTVEESNPDLLKGYTLEKNPFPASYIVKIGDTNEIENIISAIQELPGVEDIKRQQETIDTIQTMVKGIRLVGVGLFVILIGVSIFLIMNTTKLTVYARRREVGIMKFVGATDWFIRWPFIIEGMVIGVLGSVLSTVALYFLYKFSYGYITSTLTMLLVPLVDPSFIFSGMIFEFIGGGVLVGGVASFLALRKFLKV